MFKRYSDKNVLITGGLGFIGSNLARALVRIGAKVTLLDNLSQNCGGNSFNVSGLEKKLRIVLGDSRDVNTVRSLVKEQDFLFNLAGQTSHLDSMLAPFNDLHVNCEAPLAVLEACRLEERRIPIVFASTRQIYGRPTYFPVDENHPIQPIDINGVHKLAGEYYHLLYWRVHGLRCTILRLTNTIGPRMYIRDARQTFLGVWIRRLMEKEPFEVWGGNQLRDFTYVDDAVRALLLAGLSRKAAGQIFNLGGERVISLKDLADMLVSIKRGAGYEIRKYPARRKVIDIGDYFADDRRIRESLGWEPKIALPAALEQTVQYFEKHWEHYV
jgi:UDP-glucose 4-epimerase